MNTLKREEYFNLFEFAKTWVNGRFIPFTIDDLRNDYLKEYKNISRICWLGNIIKRLEDAGLIKFNDKLVKSKAKGNRGRYVKEWISAAYSDKQSKKRLLEETAKAREEQKKQINLELK